MNTDMRVTEQDDYQATFELYQTKDGPRLRLKDARMTVIGDGKSPDKWQALSTQVNKAAVQFEAEAHGVKAS
jgi:hypothetical protein